MTNFYPEKPIIPYERTTVPMMDVISHMQAYDADPEVKRAAYIMFRIESANGQSGINNNYCGFQADSGRWPAKFDASVIGVVDQDENGTGRERLFLAFDSWTSCLAFLLDRVQSRGIYIGGKAIPISDMQVTDEADLCTAYVREWAQGRKDAQPSVQDFATWHSMYMQAQALFRHGKAAPPPSPPPAPPTDSDDAETDALNTAELQKVETQS